MLTIVISVAKGVVARPQVVMTSLFFSLYKATKYYWGRHMMAQSAEKAIRFNGKQTIPLALYPHTYTINYTHLQMLV